MKIRLKTNYHNLVGKPNPLISVNLPSETAINIIDFIN